MLGRIKYKLLQRLKIGIDFISIKGGFQVSGDGWEAGLTGGACS